MPLKGYKQTKEHKKKLSEAKKKNPVKYWLGKKLPKDSVEKMRKKLKGRRQSEEAKIKNSEAHSGKKHYGWQGVNASYTAIHLWLVKKYGKANRCENSKCSHLGKRFEWALIKGKKYQRKRENFMQLCSHCHRGYDKNTIKGWITRKKYEK